MEPINGEREGRSAVRLAEKEEGGKRCMPHPMHEIETDKSKT